MFACFNLSYFVKIIYYFRLRNFFFFNIPQNCTNFLLVFFFFSTLYKIEKQKEFLQTILQFNYYVYLRTNSISETIPYAAGTRPFGQPLMLSRVLPENGDVPSKQTSKSSNSGGGLSSLFKKH